MKFTEGNRANVPFDNEFLLVDDPGCGYASDSVGFGDSRISHEDGIIDPQFLYHLLYAVFFGEIEGNRKNYNAFSLILVL